MPQDIPSPRQGPDTGGVYIPNQQIYSTVLQVNGKMDVLIMQNQGIQGQVTDHETRLRSLESTRWPLPTMSVLVALVSLSVALYVAFIK